MITTQKTTVGNGVGIYVNGKLVADVYEEKDTGKVFVMAYGPINEDQPKVICRDYTN